MGVYNWGIYIGYSLAFALGNYIKDENIAGEGWRWVFWIAAIPGFIIGPLILFTVKDPEKKQIKKHWDGDNVPVSFLRYQHRF